jgi:hypothetical protein
MNKATLIEKIKKEKAVFDAQLSELSEEEVLQPGVCGEWSVKDITAHIAVHEQRMLKWMKETLSGVTPKEYQPYDSPEQQLNALNHQIYLDNVNRPWVEVLEDFERTHQQTLKWIRSVNDEDLFDASRFGLLGGEVLWFAVAANTYEHCEEHGREIRAWMGQGQ